LDYCKKLIFLNVQNLLFFIHLIYQMKKLFVFISFSVFVFQLQAKHVSVKDASQAGLNYYRYIAHQPEAVFSSDHFFTEGNDWATTTYYVFDILPKGYIVVSADDCALPILGYSTETNWVEPTKGSNLEFWMSGYIAQINYLVSKNIAADESITLKWQEALNNNFSQKKSGHSIKPLLKSTWNQSPYYNDLCPFDVAANDRTVTGCVATAMAQILKYWNWPLKGNSSHTYTSPYGSLTANFGTTNYDWSKMPSGISSANIQIATVMYDCGVAVNMSYGTAASGGSSAYTAWGSNSALSSYSAYFKYKNGAHAEDRSNYTDPQWITLIENELNLRRPIQYSGRTPASTAHPSGEGHSWVCDGYDVNDYLNMNWGWGGSSNGYFILGGLNPAALGIGGGSGGGFDYSNEVLIGIEPNDDAYEPNNSAAAASNCPINFVNDVASMTTTDANFNKLNDTDYYKFTMPVGYDYLVKSSAYDKYYNQSVGGYTVDADVMYNVNNSWWNGSFDNYVDSFIIHGGETLTYMVYPYTQYSMGHYQLNVQFLRTAATGIESSINKNATLTISPNPAQNLIHIMGVDFKNATLIITNAIGEEMRNELIASGNQQTIDISKLANGVYFLTIKNAEQYNTSKFVVNR
jgi:hypothetical protein